MLAIFKREFKSYFTNLTGYIFIALLLCFAGIFATAVNLYNQSAMFEYTLGNLSMVLMLIVPVLSMRAVSEDKQNRTDQLLYSLPMKLSSIVIAKYMALLAVYFLSIVVMVFYPFILSAFGIIDYSSCFAALLGFFLLGAALLAISFFVSSLTESQVISAVVSFAIILALYLMNIIAAVIPATALASYLGIMIIAALLSVALYFLTKNHIVSISVAAVLIISTSVLFYVKRSFFVGLLPNCISSLAVFDRFYNFIYGIFDLTAVVYYVSIIVFFVFLTVQALEKRRWS